MGRKKKSTIETPVIPPQQDIKAIGTQPIGYQGKVSIKIQHGNKTISTRTYHNSGMPLLFKFLCSALSGDFLDGIRPCKIKLFYYPEAEKGVTPEEFNWAYAFEADAENKPKGITPFITYETTPIVKRVADVVTKNSNNGLTYHYETTFHFRVPFALISDTTVHMIGIYPNNAYYGAEEDVSAYYLFVDEETGKLWEPLELKDVAGNFSIIVDWTMALMNKPVTTVDA